jgi:hypothetical protein
MINNNFSLSQQNYQAQLRKDVANSGQNAAAQTVSQGTTGVTKQDKSKENKEMSNLSEAARKAIEQDELKDAQSKGGAENAGKAAGKAKAKEREKTKGGGGDNRVGGERQHFAAGEQQKLPNGGSIVHGDDDTPSFEISKAGTQRLAQLDDKNLVQATIVDTMPAHAKAVAGKMVEEKTETPKKREKFADLKMGNDKFSGEVEGVITEPTHQLDARGKVGKAEIRSAKHEKPTFVEDPHAETIMKEQAKNQLASGNHHEAFVA